MDVLHLLVMASIKLNNKRLKMESKFRSGCSLSQYTLRLCYKSTLEFQTVPWPPMQICRYVYVY